MIWTALRRGRIWDCRQPGPSVPCRRNSDTAGGRDYKRPEIGCIQISE